MPCFRIRGAAPCGDSAERCSGRRGRHHDPLHRLCSVPPGRPAAAALDRAGRRPAPGQSAADTDTADARAGRYRRRHRADTELTQGHTDRGTVLTHGHMDTRVSPHFFWLCKLASKYKVTCHGRDTLTKDGGSPLSFDLPQGPKRLATPIARSKLEIVIRSSSYTHSKALAEENRPELFAPLYYKYFEKYKRKTKWPLSSSLFR